VLTEADQDALVDGAVRVLDQVLAEVDQLSPGAAGQGTEVSVP